MTDVIFLPGIIAPASVRYAALLERLDGINAIVKDLEVYAGADPYSIDSEIDGIDDAADRAGLDRFHLYGHSGGGACVLAYVAARPDRVLTVTVDEPASDFTDDDHNDPYWNELSAADALPPEQAVGEFLRLQLAPDAPMPPRPDGPPPPWMTSRPAGIAAFRTALAKHRVDGARYRAFDRPVLYTHGSLSHPRWTTMRERLAGLFPTFRAELFEGLHHLNTSHQAEPDRVAALLRAHWASA